MMFLEDDDGLEGCILSTGMIQSNMPVSLHDHTYCKIIKINGNEAPGKKFQMRSKNGMNAQDGAELIKCLCHICNTEYGVNCKFCIKCQSYTIFRCLHPKCGNATYSSASTARAHVKRVHFQNNKRNVQVQRTMVEMKCPKCSKSFSCAKYMKQHLFLTCKPADICCKYCKYKTKWQNNLERHVKSSHPSRVQVDENEAPRVCDRCEREFFTTHGLKIHKKHCQA